MQVLFIIMNRHQYNYEEIKIITWVIEICYESENGNKVFLSLSIDVH